MKELSMEEKAKAYDEAIKKIQEIIIMGNVPVTPKEIGEYLFPKLKESDDEKIRKYLIDVVRDYVTGSEYEGCIAWLEKQGEKIQYWKPSEDQLEALDYAYNSCPDTERGNYYEGVLESLIYDLHKLPEKQCEKSADKVEPKFNAGDWITDGQLTCKVLGITGKSCELHLHNDDYCHFETDIQSVNKYYRLWTIQDAKDGDVLVGSKEWNVILMFRGIGNTEWNDVIDYHCYYDCYRKDFVVQKDVEYWGNTENNQLKPATKEQHDLLFQKMKEAGYEWNTEKKELKKIGQKPNNSQFTPEQADIIDKHIDNFLGRKSAWSKNDEEMWIDAIKYLELFDAQGIHGDVAVPCMEWLKSLKDRVQPKQEWSEDDKGNMLSVKCVIDKAWHNQDFREDTGYSAEELESLWNWFDNIWQRVKYPQNPWKPSEEQMKWFSDIIDYHQFSTKGQKIMQSLYNDLKKLKER